ncbi:hypothetical protein [Ichthyobacterium seriolicida]|uniref:Uncharacterized protein n=1 Tax=Ichthyobacterium seriolicida TaxID=242600 RepID=A0A1J1E160_9FLAO|nr:hypothetical protein [Ichthyobacterium seriolicida]BAV94677.1 hypothetical protein JBKA6_0664 [Ichthyobacterium seriolicida]
MLKADTSSPVTLKLTIATTAGDIPASFGITLEAFKTEGYVFTADSQNANKYTATIPFVYKKGSIVLFTRNYTATIYKKAAQANGNGQ